MPEWRTSTLGAICSEGGGGIQTGPFGSQLHAADYVEQGIPSVMPQNIGGNIIDPHGIARITEQDASRLSRYLLRQGDIVYSRRGDVEKRALVRAENDGWLCGTGCLRVRLGQQADCDPRFVAYYLGTEDARAWIVRHAVGATMPNLNTSILSAVPIRFPTMREQQSIAEVLGALDDKIVANSALATTANELASHEFRLIMRGAQETTTLGQILTLEYGKALPADQRRPGHVVVYGSGGVVGQHDEALVDRCGVVVGRKGTAGAVHWASRPHFPIDTTFLVVPAHDVPLTFCYFALRSAGLDQMNSDSAVPGLNRIEAHATPLPCPSAAERWKFDQLVGPLLELAAQFENESFALAEMRDALLPALMSERLRVKDAERVVGEVV